MAATSLGDVIDRERRRSFVGRQSELRSFDEARAGRSRRRVLFVHGPGGMGKTTLLLEMRARASADGQPTVLRDGSEIDPSPDGFRQAAGTAAASAQGELGRAHGGTVLLVDGTTSSALSTAGCARTSSRPCRPTTWWCWPAASHPPPHGAPTGAGGRWSRSIPWGTSAALTARTRWPGPASRRPTSSGCSVARAWLTTEDLLRKTVGTDAAEVWGWLRRAYTAVASFIATPDQALAPPGVLDRVIALGMAAPQYPLPGPARRELLDAIA